MDWVKNIFGIGSQDKQPSKSVPDRDKNTNRDTSNKKRRAQQPLLVEALDIRIRGWTGIGLDYTMMRMVMRRMDSLYVMRRMRRRCGREFLDVSRVEF
jgi:hypothetical protein